MNHSPILRFVLGRAGAGKTHHCLEAVRARLRQNPLGPPLVLLLPDQATFQMERALAETPGLGGFLRAHVLSFRRLAHRLAQEVGGAGAPPVGELRRLLILKSVLGRIGDSLKFYKRSAGKIGFARSVDAALAEWRRYGLGPDDIEARAGSWEASGEAGPPLALKLQDLARIERAYREAIAGRQTDPEDYLIGFEERIAASQAWRGAEVWVDGFSSFTAQERRALIGLVRAAQATDVALCLDPEELKRSGAHDAQAARPFAACEKTYWTLRSAAEASGVALAPDLALSSPPAAGRFADSPALAAIESAFFERDALGAIPPDASRAVRIVCAPTPVAEAEFAARETLRFVREEGFRFSEIGFILRSLEGRHDVLTAILQRLGIPYFLDRKREANRHPLAELLSASAWIVVRGWRSDDVLQALKTDLLPATRDEADRIENHAVECGLDGRDWLDADKWAEPEAVEKALAPLRAFEKQCRGARERAWVRASDFADGLKRLLDETRALETVERWAEDSSAQGNPEKSAEHRQVGEGIAVLLDEWSAGLGDMRLPWRECAELLEEGLASMQLGLAPPTLDHVLIGAIERSRHPELRVVFVLGMNEKTFPMAPAEDPILGDADRERMAAAGVELGPRASERALNEPFLAYIAMTRPRERLILTHAARDEANRLVAPSPFIERVRELLPDTPIEALGAPDADDAARVHDSASLGAAAARALGKARMEDREPEPRWLALTALGLEYEREERAVSRRLRGLFQRNDAALSRDTARALYAEKTAFGATRLESMAACAFQCFAKHGLGLRPRQAFQLEPVDRGQLLHAVLARVFHRLKKAGRAWRDADEATLGRWINEEIEREADELRGGLLRQSGRGRFLLESLRRILLERVRALREESAAGHFQQAFAEASFGFPDSRFPAPRVALDEEASFSLHGVIDRIDLAELENGSVVVRVMDYKTGGLRFSPALARHGIYLQLPVYLLAVAGEDAGRGWRPAGFFYSPLVAGIETDAGDPEDDADEARAYRASGLFDAALIEAMDATVEPGGASKFWRIARKKDGSFTNAESRTDAVGEDDLRIVLRQARETMTALGRAMLGGEVAVAPYRCGAQTACDWCDFRPVCRFDESLQTYREIPAETRSEALARMREALNNR